MQMGSQRKEKFAPTLRSMGETNELTDVGKKFIPEPGGEIYGLLRSDSTEASVSIAAILPFSFWISIVLIIFR